MKPLAGSKPISRTVSDNVPETRPSMRVGSDEELLELPVVGCRVGHSGRQTARTALLTYEAQGHIKRRLSQGEKRGQARVGVHARPQRFF